MRYDFTELTRVQMPAMMHLLKLGYKYYGKLTENDGGAYDNSLNQFDSDTNILLEVFKRSFVRLNPEHKGEYLQCLREIHNILDNDDLGRSFYEKMLKASSPYKLIDFENIANNEYHVTAEFTCKNGEDEFRPDITLFINGLPLCFIEVKKKDNQNGIVAEIDRMNNKRFPNKKFRRFLNLTQLMIFSNNMEYSAEGGITPVQGVFYCTTARKKAFFNCFREDKHTEKFNNSDYPYSILEYPYLQLDEKEERKILEDFNCSVIKCTEEYQTNCDVDTPTNRVLTSMCSRERLLFLLHYGVVYLNAEKEEDGKRIIIDEKHIMRYQQMLGALAICDKLAKGQNSGIVWHTQGSGKTALSYYLQSILTDFYAKRNTVAKFYFVVDRIDLLNQAAEEFNARGLRVSTPDTREELMQQFRNTQSQENSDGKPEITVINIQRFAEDTQKIDTPAYAANLQRIFVVDEAHRGYKPDGSFLGNLLNADKNAVKIALTGTPLLKEERESWKIFGNYYHTYYYDKSIEDGYTLKIIREDIEKGYKERLTQIMGELDELVQKKQIKKSDIFEHEKYVDEFIRYVIDDMSAFRIVHGDDTLGGMIVATSGPQARIIAERFQKIQEEKNAKVQYESDKTNFKIHLILHDSADKATIRQQVADFKKRMTVDFLVVDKMLLTGFDAPRLKKLYLGKRLKDHTLLQALTRVNRPYKDMHYGYVVDFANISAEFEEVNKAYLEELQRFNDPEEVGGDFGEARVLLSEEEIKEAIAEVKEVLFKLPTDNREEFGDNLQHLTKVQLVVIRKALNNLRELYNITKTYGTEEEKELFARFGDMKKTFDFLKQVQARIDMVNFEEKARNGEENLVSINEALRYIDFVFNKIGTDELDFVSGDEKADLKKLVENTVRKFAENQDQDDPIYIDLRRAFREKFYEYNFKEITDIEEFKQRRRDIEEIYHKLISIDTSNNAIMQRYNGDRKYLRIHKRITEHNQTEKSIISERETEIADFLNKIKRELDNMIYDRQPVLDNETFFRKEALKVVIQTAKALGKKIPVKDSEYIADRIVSQYMEQLDGDVA